VGLILWANLVGLILWGGHPCPPKFQLLVAPQNSLAVYEGDSERYYILVPNSLDMESGSIRLLADIPEQAIVRLTDTTRDEIIAASLTSFKTA
jgi:hypothetical protein